MGWGTAVVVGTEDDVTGVAPAVAAGDGVGVSPAAVSCSPEGRVGVGVAAVVVNGDEGTGI